MRTLVHCTAYAQSRWIWESRYRRWVDAILGNDLGQNQILLVDDGSPVLPGWPDADIQTIQTPDDVAGIRSTAPILLLRYANRLGRAAIYDFPGWHRSFVTGIRYATARKFKKVIHLESDAYLISPRTLDWARDTTTGWTALWTAKYNFPEIAIQVIGADQMAAADEFARRPYDSLVGVTHETALPLTHIEKRFAGERYGEDEPPVPAHADFATQIPAQREPSYYWWLRGASGPAPALPGRLELTFGDGQDGVSLLGEGWAKPERGGCWMLRAFSVLTFPSLPEAPAYDLVIAAAPHVHRVLRPVQRLCVQVNAAILGDFEFPSAQRVGLEIPGSILRRDGTDRLRFFHPDAAAPQHLSQGKDGRVLALMLLGLSIQPRPDGAGPVAAGPAGGVSVGSGSSGAGSSGAGSSGAGSSGAGSSGTGRAPA